MTGPDQWEPVPEDVPITPVGAAPAPANPAPNAQPAWWTPAEQSRIVQFAKTAKTPEELDAFAAGIGHDRGLRISDAKAIIDYRNKHGTVTTEFLKPPGVAAATDQVPEGFEQVRSDTKVDYGTLSGLSPDEIKAKYESHPDAEIYRRAVEAGAAPAGMTPLEQHGFTAGLDTEVKSLGSAALQFILHPIEAVQSGGGNVSEAYHDARTEALARIDYLKMLHGGGGTAEEIGGAISNPLGIRAAATKYLPLVAAGGGLVSGFEDGNGTLDERLGQGVKTAATAAVLAPVATLALRAPGAVVQAGRTVLGGSPGLARRIIAKAIAADGKTGGEVGAEMASAHANDVPYMLADSGDNARGLLAASARTPGPARTIARQALEDRQTALGERVTNAIERDLGPVSNPHEVADQMMTRANRAAAPLYAAAYSRPGADTFARSVAPLLARPSMKTAFASAYRLAQEEGEDPTTLGFDLNAAGEPVLTRAPSWKTLDYVKRGMDDVVESYRDKTSGKLRLNTEGKAINNTLRSYIAAFDKANPEYGAARAAYGGPVRGIDAMNQGRKALNMTADDLEARMRDMTPFEKEMFALGTRRAMAELISSKGDSANVINALAGTGKKRAMLARLFGNRQQFGRFVDTLLQEKEGFRTFARAMTGSPTAGNLQDDAALEFASAAVDIAANGGLPIATAIKQAWKFGVGHVGEKTKKQVAALLSETDPTRFQDLARDLRAEIERRSGRNRRIGAASLAITRDLTTPASQPAQ